MNDHSQYANDHSQYAVVLHYYFQSIVLLHTTVYNRDLFFYRCLIQLNLKMIMNLKMIL